MQIKLSYIRCFTNAKTQEHGRFHLQLFPNESSASVTLVTTCSSSCPKRSPQNEPKAINLHVLGSAWKAAPKSLSELFPLLKDRQFITRGTKKRNFTFAAK